MASQSSEVALERAVAKLDEIDRRTLRHGEILDGDGDGNPGLVLKVDRIETLINLMRWIGGGGFVAFSGTLYLLYRILRAVDDTGGLP